MFQVFKISKVDDSTNITHIYYIGTKQYSYEEFDTDPFSNYSIAHIVYTWTFKNSYDLRSKVCYVDCNGIINSLYVAKDYRNWGLGSILLKHAIDDTFNNNGLQIELDDVSARSRKSKNIYVKFGFEYVYDGGPEMILHK